MLDESIVEVPSEKSDHYIARTSEQAISDRIIKSKAYATSSDIKICLLYVCGKALGDSLEKMSSLQVNEILTHDSNSPIIESGTTHFQGRKAVRIIYEIPKSM